jgi:hypothetical protein
LKARTAATACSGSSSGIVLPYIFAIVKYIVAFSKYILMRRAPGGRRSYFAWGCFRYFESGPRGGPLQATTMIRLRNWVREARPSWRSSRVSERRESGR